MLFSADMVQRVRSVFGGHPVKTLVLLAGLFVVACALSVPQYDKAMADRGGVAAMRGAAVVQE
jgi:hypothetical protein